MDGLVLALGEEMGMDVRHLTSAGDLGSSEHLVELLISTDGFLQVNGLDLFSLTLEADLTTELEDLTHEVLEDTSHEDTTALTERFSVTALSHQAHASSRGDYESSFNLSGDGFSFSGSGSGSTLSGCFTLGWHFVLNFEFN